MCEKITCDNFIINYFYKNKINEVSIKVLEEKKINIEKAFNKNIYIDLYKDSIYETIIYNKYIFSLCQDNNIIKCDYKKIRKRLLNDLNYYIPIKVKRKYLKELVVVN
jgi:hypothetical protein